MMSEQNIETINGVPIDWSLYKGKDNNRSKKSYIGLCKLLHNKNHELLSEYINATTKVLIDFNCGHESCWITPNHYKNGRGCPKCVGKGGQAKEDLINVVSKNNHKLLSEYINATTKVLIDFNCEHEPNWVTPDSYKRGTGCPKCSGKCSEQAKEEFLIMLEENGHTILSKYKNNSTKVLINFNCGHQPHWIKPNSYKNGNRCPKCSDSCPEQAKENLVEMINNNGHKLLSEYINNSTKVLINFNCGHEPHWITPNCYKRGRGCPLCKNKGESFLYELLLNMKYEVEKQKKYYDLKDKLPLAYDFYLPEYNLLIELDGDHHRIPIPYKTKNMTQQEKDMEKLDAEIRFHNRQRKDRLKDDYAKNNNIPLLRIEYYDGKVELDKWRELILNKIKEIEVKRELIAL